jgi:hypothetical protein
MEAETTMEHHRQVLPARREPIGVRHALSQASSGFVARHDRALADGAVPATPLNAGDKSENLGELVLDAAGTKGG